MKISDLFESSINDDDYYLVDRRTKKIVRNVGSASRLGYHSPNAKGEVEHKNFDQFYTDKSNQAVMKGMSAKHRGYKLTEAAETVELTEFKGKRIPYESWPGGLEYKGENVFNFIYDKRPTALESIEGKWKRQGTNEYQKVDHQECYLGYSPSKDVFVQGYDGWAQEEDDYGDYEDVNISPFIIFAVDGDRISIMQQGLTMGSADTMWYADGGGYDAAHKKYPDLIDIRLD